MSGSDRPRRPPDPSAGGRSAPGGTPVPVDISKDRRTRLAWLVFLAGPIIWITHWMVVYLVAEAGCTGDAAVLEWFDPPVPVVTTLVATVVAVPLCVAATVWAWRWWRHSAEDPQAAPDASTGEDEATGDRHPSTLAFAGFLLSAFSAVAILFTAVPATVLHPC